jgi:hypothetical protein
MVKRLSKSRRSAILEHLLALEKQIRAELGGDDLDERARKAERTKRKKALSSARHGQRERDDQSMGPPGFIARSMH